MGLGYKEIVYRKMMRLLGCWWCRRKGLRKTFVVIDSKFVIFIEVQIVTRFHKSCNNFGSEFGGATGSKIVARWAESWRDFWIRV